MSNKPRFNRSTSQTSDNLSESQQADLTAFALGEADDQERQGLSQLVEQNTDARQLVDEVHLLAGAIRQSVAMESSPKEVVPGLRELVAAQLEREDSVNNSVELKQTQHETLGPSLEKSTGMMVSMRWFAAIAVGFLIGLVGYFGWVEGWQRQSMVLKEDIPLNESARNTRIGTGTQFGNAA